MALTRSGGKGQWVSMDDPYYIPPHLAAPFSKEDLEAYVQVFREGDEGDGDADGFIEVR